MLHRTGERAAATSLPPPPSSLLCDASLFLDFDGTLVELVEQPDLVAVEPAIATLLTVLSTRLSGRLAIVSGRPAAQIRRLIGMPTLAIGGSHGLEIEWDDTRRNSVAAPASLATVGAAFDRLAGEHPGSLVERKPLGTAFHYRSAPAAGSRAADLAAALAEETGLVVQPGKMMIELRLGDADKGSAVHAFMSEPPRAGTVPIFIGDDLTDEPAFAAAATLGGAGILVGDVRESAARYRLPDVAATLAWLERAAT